MLDGETVANVLIGEHSPGQIAHDLMHRNHDLSAVLWRKGDRLDVGIDLAPLLAPVGADFFRPTNETAFERFGPGHIGSHQGESGIDVARVEGGIRRAEQFVWCGLLHINSMYNRLDAFRGDQGRTTISLFSVSPAQFSYATVQV